MSKSENQKLKILYIAKYLYEKTDENHAVGATDIKDYLMSDYGIASERRSIYRDINILRDVFGMNIDGTQGKKFKLISREFELDDLRLLAECVYSAKFISDKRAKDLIETIGGFCSEYQEEELKSEVFLCDRVKTTQNAVLRNIVKINEAMSTRESGKPRNAHKITFKYLKSSLSNVNSQVERRNGDTYKVSPYKLLINEGNYYLLAFYDKSKKIRTYRVDRMTGVDETKEKRDGKEIFDKIDMNTYRRRTFNMFSGETKRVTLEFENRFLDTVAERFGTGHDVFYMPQTKQTFSVNVDVDISNQFFGWLCNFGRHAKIKAPDDVVEMMKEHISKIQSIY
ncbi:MAG: WYL domain-containing protein [Clostridia bacterium]|nr:WYL domain-containing protein [Clostridia bacterium]